MTSYTIYAIVNLANGKRYIGQSKKFTSRRVKHLYQLKRNKHENLYLQNAYNKYGESLFVWEILESEIPTHELANEREIHWIAQYPDNYNLTQGGYGAANYLMQSCQWNGIEYESISEAARILNIPQTTMARYVKKGYRQDSDVPPATRMVSWNNITYSTLNEAAKAIGVTRKTMRDYLAKGYAKDSDVIHLDKPVTWNNIEYPSIGESARANNVPKPTMQGWIAKGYTADSDVPVQAIPVVWNNIEYPSISEAARSNNRERTILAKWLSKGYACDDDVPYLRKQRKSD